MIKEILLKDKKIIVLNYDEFVKRAVEIIEKSGIVCYYIGKRKLKMALQSIYGFNDKKLKRVRESFKYLEERFRERNNRIEFFDFVCILYTNEEKEMYVVIDENDDAVVEAVEWLKRIEKGKRVSADEVELIEFCCDDVIVYYSWKASIGIDMEKKGIVFVKVDDDDTGIVLNESEFERLKVSALVNEI